MSNCSGCCSTTSNNGFSSVLIFSDVALPCSSEINFLKTLISNNFVHRYLIAVKNPYVGCKDYFFISIGFCLGMKVFGQD
jgi:hypothetical protein